MVSNRVLWFVAVAVVVLVSGYPEYKVQIPNGNNVPNPCDTSSLWPGVGHQVSSGTVARNPFGVDFASHNHTWTQALCQADSDGDGTSNGAELGDVNCTWTVGSTPSSTTGLSHPGICEPLNSATCQSSNNFVVCPGQ